MRATKQMEMFKAPPILVVNLKRFKQSGGQSRFFGLYSGGGYGQKIDAYVDFPLDGLDLTDMVKGETDRDGGPKGFGHYTAYARSAVDDFWYEFDDSRVSKISRDPGKNVVTAAAYNLFYRRRDWHAKNREQGCNWSEVSVKPDMDFL